MMQNEADTDESLIRQSVAGHFSAFEEFFRRHEQRLLNFLLRLCGKEAVARELFEKTAAEFYRLRLSQAAAEEPSTTLFSVACRLALRLMNEDKSVGIPGLGLTVGDQASLEWRSSRLNHVLLSLPIKERVAILLCFFDSFSYAQAASCLTEKEQNIRTLCGQGLKRLHEDLGPQFLSGGLP
jgi:DNA-directed RNA polymerase specialized sigma24 family protein